MIVWLICLCLFWVTIFRMLHNATPHYDNGKHSSQPKVTQKSHICIKNQSCKPCSQSENCCPTISHYNTPFHYDSFSMLTGLSIPYSLTKDHCYMSELSLFPAYVRTDIRSDWPETHSIGGCKAKGRIPPSWWYPAFARSGSRPVPSTTKKSPQTEWSGGIFLGRHSYALGTAH